MSVMHAPYPLPCHMGRPQALDDAGLGILLVRPTARVTIVVDMEHEVVGLESGPRRGTTAHRAWEDVGGMHN